MNGSSSRLAPLLIVLAVVGAAALGLRACRRAPSMPRETAQLADELTAIAVREAVALAGPGGDVVVLGIDRPPEMTDPFSARYTTAFRDTAGREGLTIRAEEKLPPNPELERTGEPVTRADFIEALRRHASAKLVVLMFPPPAVSAADLSTLPAERSKVLVLTNWQSLHLRKLPKGLIHVAIVPRVEPPAGNAIDFASQFEVIK